MKASKLQPRIGYFKNEQTFAGRYTKRYYTMNDAVLIESANPNVANQKKVSLNEKYIRNTSSNRKIYLK